MRGLRLYLASSLMLAAASCGPALVAAAATIHPALALDGYAPAPRRRPRARHRARDARGRRAVHRNLQHVGRRTRRRLRRARRGA